MGTGERNPPNGGRGGEGYGCAQDLIWASSLAGSSRRCHAAFYNSRLMLSQCSNSLFVSDSRLWSAQTWAVTRGAWLPGWSAKTLLGVGDSSVSLSPPFFNGEVQRRDGRCLVPLCPFFLPSSVFPGGRARLGRVNTRRHSQFQSEIFEQGQIGPRPRGIYSKKHQRKEEGEVLLNNLGRCV